MKITSVLIANRGEIAARIAKTLKMRGVRVYMLKTVLDGDAVYLNEASEILELSGQTLAETYLNQSLLLELCCEEKIQAVHPGYGFLSENALFAEQCEKNQIHFIGPSAKSIAAMGSKAAAKKLMQENGIPVVPGYNGDDQSDETLQKEAVKIGFPLLIKASAGGGGKGMRIVREADQVPQALQSARSESKKSFGDDRLILERYIQNPRHVEIQIFGDKKGNIIHLGERECSIQRRHQKIIEESPSPALDAKLRQQMGEAAVKCGKTLGYYNAGTVEFILDESGKFYFLEVNTRLQVEHPVTEMVTGLDLVDLQLKIAEGTNLPYTQEQISFRGHALECRLYAEDPAQNFFPSTGKLVRYREPSSPYLRIDSGVTEGSEVTLNFDPMLAKIITWGETREQSIARMIWTLQNFPVLGVKTNAAYLKKILEHPVFQKGSLNTHFVEDHADALKLEMSPGLVEILSRLFETREVGAQTQVNATSSSVSGVSEQTWARLSGFRVGVK